MLASLIKLLLFQGTFSFLVIYLSKKLKLLDYPNRRKIHKSPIPYTGGFILSISFLVIITLTDASDKFLNLILSFGILACLAGLIDDKYKVNPGTKIILQIIPIFFIIDQDLYLISLGSYSYFGEINLGSFSKIFTIFCCLLLVNAFNYSDGVDGLLTSITIIIMVNFIIFNNLFLQNIDLDFYLLIVLTLIIFLFYNFGLINKYKAFLGDSGSNLLGYVISFLSIYFFSIKNIHPVLVIWPLAYLVFEFLAVTLIRLFKNNNVFKPGNDHLHYEIKNIFGINNFLVLLIILGINVIFSLIGYYLYKYFNPDVSIIVFIIFFILFLAIRIKMNKIRLKQSKN